MSDFIPALVILTSVALIVVNQVIHWVIRSRVPARLYLKHLYPRRTNQAFEKGDARRAEREIYQAYLEQLLDPNPTVREIAIQYLAQLSATQALADRLIEALRFQRPGDFQNRLAQLLRDTLHDLTRNGPTTSTRFTRTQSAWVWALTIWITEVIVVVAGWFYLPVVPVEQFVLLGAAVAGITFLPLTWLVREKRWLAQWAAFSTGIALALLWTYSDMTHSGTSITAKVPLEKYGFPNTELQIVYPRWLTADDVELCANRPNKVTMVVYGNNQPAKDPVEISFKNDLKTLKIVDKGCMTLDNQFLVDSSVPAGKSIDFFVKPTNREALLKQQVTIVPQVRNPASSRSAAVPVSELAFVIRFEDQVWQAIRNICQVGAGVATLPAFLAFLFIRLRREQTK
jgi:hypothetical protein